MLAIDFLKIRCPLSGEGNSLLFPVFWEIFGSYWDDWVFFPLKSVVMVNHIEF